MGNARGMNILASSYPSHVHIYGGKATTGYRLAWQICPSNHEIPACLSLLHACLGPPLHCCMHACLRLPLHCCTHACLGLPLYCCIVTLFILMGVRGLSSRVGTREILTHTS